MIKNNSYSSFKIDTFFSEKIKIISFFDILIVMYENSGIIDDSSKKMTAPVIVYYSTAGFWGNCAVPIFYAISGFLFFYGASELSSIISKIKKRTKTLLIPFIIAAIYYPLFFVIMELTPLKQYIDRGSLIEFCTTHPIGDVIKMLFYGSSDGYPWAYHLWFMRDLITIVALSPIIFYVRKGLKYYSIIISALLYLIFPYIRVLDALTWFLFGSLLLDKIQRIPTKVTWIISILYLLIVIYRLLTGDQPSNIEKLIEISLGIISIWSIYDKIVTPTFNLSSHHWLYIGCQFTFFIYLYHEPIMHLMVKSIVLIMGKNAVGLSLGILLPPLLITPICIMIGYVLKIIVPSFYKILVGGR